MYNFTDEQINRWALNRKSCGKPTSIKNIYTIQLPSGKFEKPKPNDNIEKLLERENKREILIFT